MKSFKSLTAVAVLALATLATSSANAQAYGRQGGYNYNNGSNWGQQKNLQWNVQQGTAYQRPGAAIIGGILQGLGPAIAGNNPKNQQTGAILGAIGNGFVGGSGRQSWSQGNVMQSQQGYQNNWGQGNAWNGGFRQPAIRQPTNNWNGRGGGASNNFGRRW